MALFVSLESLLLLLFFFVLYHVVKYRNPYKLYMVFGKKGSGKTTLMTKLAIQYQKKGWTVFCDREIPGVYPFKTEDFGRVQFPPNSLVLVDEVGLVWDNRNFKSFPEHVKVYFKYQRQYRHVVYLFSQSFDVDKKIRDLTDHLYIVSNVFNCFSIARRVTKRLVVVHADKSAQGESKIVDDYSIDSLLLAFFGSVRVTYIPRWAKYFKSFNPPQLPPYEGDRLPEYKQFGKLASWKIAIRERKDTLRKWNRGKRG